MSRSLLIFALVPVLLGLLLPAVRAEDAEEEGDEAPKVTEATPETVKELLANHATAVKSKEANELRKALEEMLPYNNEKLKKPLLDALKYKLSPADKRAVMVEVREKGVRKPKRVKAMMAFREEQVQMVAAKGLANHPGKDTEKTLARIFMNKNMRKDKPFLTSHVIESLGKLGYTRLLGEIEGEFRKFKSRDIMRAAVRYFGLTKEKSVAKMLCAHIDEPAPANVNSPTNPPASYWKARWEAWDYIKTDVVWALQQQITITEDEPEGQVFKTSKQARDWIKDHGRKIGIR